MINRLRQYFIRNDENCKFYKKQYEIFDELMNFNYSKMLFTGSSDDILDLNKTSMFLWNDPIEIIVRHTRILNCKPLSNAEIMLLKNTKNLIKTTNMGKRFLKIAEFSGITHANDLDWGTLDNYGKSLIPRSEWRQGGIYYGFETDEDYQYLVNEISAHITNAIHHKWTNRLYFENSNKSHRLAALYRQTINQNRNTVLKLELTEKNINIDCVKTILDNFWGIITTEKTYTFFVEIFKSINIKVLLLNEKYPSEQDSVCVLWIEKTQNKLLARIINFISHLLISHLPSDQCYVVNSFLESFMTED